MKTKGILVLIVLSLFFILCFFSQRMLIRESETLVHQIEQAERSGDPGRFDAAAREWETKIRPRWEMVFDHTELDDISRSFCRICTLYRSDPQNSDLPAQIAQLKSDLRHVPEHAAPKAENIL